MLFDCYFSLANLTKSREHCDELYDKLEDRYNCYYQFLNINKDQEFCENSTNNNVDYFQCLSTIGLKKGADYCYFQMYGAEFFPEANQHRGNRTYLEECLLEQEYQLDASMCSLQLKELQQATFTNTSTYLTFQDVIECFQGYNIPTNYLACQL